MNEINVNRVKIHDSFWTSRQDLIMNVTVPYMEKILRDEIEGAERSHAIENFRIAAGLSSGEFYGMVFQDSDVYKWLEAAAYCLGLKPDRELEKRFDETVELISKAQAEDGYINTWFTIKQPGQRWTDFLSCHELYCAGHLFEAAAAAYEAVGKTSLLEIAGKFASHIVSEFMDSDVIPGHEEVEIGLLRLYRVTGKKEYLKMAARFLDSRGKDPKWFEKHTPDTGTVYGIYNLDPKDNVYNQSDMPVLEQKTSRGHAVRMLYLLTAMADEANTLGDKEMYEVCLGVLKNTVSKKMYITGGLGARERGESFGDDWELPNDSCYNETCASVAMVFFTQRMLLNKAESLLGDVMELELYNGALAGMQLDGKRFFYVNPLEVDPTVSGIRDDLKHVMVERPAWYSCACCPPNLARLIVSLGKYIWGEDESCVYLHQFIGSSAALEHAGIECISEYPWKCRGRLIIRPKTKESFSVALRVPAYAEAANFKLNGERIEGVRLNGYEYIKREWCDSDVLEFDFAVRPRLVESDAHIAGNAGHRALVCGPLVYCVEQADNRLAADQVKTGKGDVPELLPFEEDTLNGVARIKCGQLTAIPYYAWANRGKGWMKVWLPTE